MKSILGDATFIGFTGTPLLKKDKQTSMEVFGRFIHTYKYDEAVRDRSVLDLRYEARNIDQSLLPGGVYVLDGGPPLLELALRLNGQAARLLLEPLVHLLR